jgi:hypothetical protein
MPNFSGIWTVTQQMQAKGQSIWPAVPGAPTIGTATATGSTTATVAFTAGSTGYPATITGYTATSSPGGITGTGASSPISMTGLSTGTAYTFTVTATNASGTGPASAASNSITPAIQPGDAYGGGYFAGQISTAGNGIADYNLVVGPLSSAESSSKQCKTTNTTTVGTNSVIDGPTNSALMNNASHPAGEFCENLTIGGFSDWYLPAINEIEVCYYNLKPTSSTNSPSFGANTNAVPSRSSNYTTNVPTQTSATAFQSGNSQAFTVAYYWSSTQGSVIYEYGKTFDEGSAPIYTKTTNFRVRAIRRVAV